MPSAGVRRRTFRVSIEVPTLANKAGLGGQMPTKTTYLPDGTQYTESESHRYDAKKRHYDGGGPFYTTRLSSFVNPGYITDAYSGEFGPRYYSGPVWPNFPSSEQLSSVSWKGQIDPSSSERASWESSLNSKGATAISLSNPVNPVSNLGTTLAETFREGVPSLPGIQLWKAKTKILKGFGSEYLNYQFGWDPLRSEVESVRDAARHHRDIMKQYQRGEGRNTRRRFDFPLQKQSVKGIEDTGYSNNPLSSSFINVSSPIGRRRVSKVEETKTWFEGCFTYALPSSTDSWGKVLSAGDSADHLFGIKLTPDVLWELTPWSWAVDWFSNAGDVINNVTNFGTAGLVMRYGYMMYETIERVTVEVDVGYFNRKTSSGITPQQSGPSSCGYERRTKVRTAANPFGFGIGWEGLSPTQLAITAALGISRLL